MECCGDKHGGHLFQQREEVGRERFLKEMISELNSALKMEVNESSNFTLIVNIVIESISLGSEAAYPSINPGSALHQLCDLGVINYSVPQFPHL